MAYNHGVKVTENPTSILPPVSVSASVPFIVGTAPVNMTDTSNVNKPVLCYSYADAVKAFGFVSPKDGKFEYSISEFIYSQFALFGAAPVIIVNVLDATKHATAFSGEPFKFVDGVATLDVSGVIPGTIKLSGTLQCKQPDGSDSESLDAKGIPAANIKIGTDADGRATVTLFGSYDDGSGYIFDLGTAQGDGTAAGSKLDPSVVTASDVIGGVDTDGNKSGFELVSECFPRFRIVPGVLLAPGFSDDATLAAVMATKAAEINSEFSAIALVDLPADKKYSEIVETKNANNITDPHQIACYPMLSLDGVQYHLSTQLAGVIAITDSQNDDVPYCSPSNHSLKCTATVLSDGTEIWLAPDTAAYLNGNGIVTVLNFTDGWKLWGNRTAAYPGKTDVKDTFIPIRRMFSWVGNTLVQTFWQKVDAPLNRRLVETIVDSANIWLNGLTARQYILGGRVEFLESENTTTDLMDGKAHFHVYITPPSPAREIDFVLEYDPEYLATLFG